MSKVALLGYPYFGHVNPTINLVKALVNRGEEVYYYTIEPYMKYFNMENVICRDYGDILGWLEEEIVVSTTEPLEVLKHIVPHKLNQHKRMSNMLMQQIMKDDPDYIIRDCEAYWGKMIGTMLDIPVICYITTIALNETMLDQQPAFFLQHVLGSPTGTIPDAAVGMRFSEYLNTYTQELAEPYGIDFKAIDAFSGADELNLVFTTREFQPFIESFGPAYHFIGPPIRTNKMENSLNTYSQNASPVIYISLGTVYNDCLSFYKKCIEAFKNSDCHLIMSIGTRIDLKDLGDIPAHIDVRAHVAQTDILQQTDVFITHGGHNSVNEALYYEVPMLLFPQAADQFVVSKRVMEIGAGIVANSTDCSAAGIASMTFEILDDSSYREACVKAGAAIRNTQGVESVIETIFAHVKGDAVWER